MTTPLDPHRPIPNSRPTREHGRDPERIDAVVEQVRSLWKQYPQLRLLQLLVAIADPHPNRLFYVEDSLLSEKLCRARDTGRLTTQEAAEGEP